MSSSSAVQIRLLRRVLRSTLVPADVGGHSLQSSCSVSTLTALDVPDDGDCDKSVSVPSNNDAFEETVASETRLDEAGDGGNSDEEGDEAILHSKCVDHARVSGAVTRNGHVEYSVEDNRGDHKAYVELTSRGSRNIIETTNLLGTSDEPIILDGVDEEVKIP